MGMGDEIMATGDARVMHEQYGDPVVIFDRRDQPRYHPIFQNNPKIIQPGKWNKNAPHSIVRSGPGRRPYADYEAIEALGKTKTDLRERKALRRAAGRLCFNMSYRAPKGEIFFNAQERDFGQKFLARTGPYVIIEPNVKGRVPGKQWGWAKWQALANILLKQHTVIQIGAKGPCLDGVVYTMTPDVRMGLSVLANAWGFIAPEGGMHHAAGALSIPGVVLFAGRTPPELMSYDPQTVLSVRHPAGACGVEHQDCPLCRKWYEALEPEVVAGKFMDRVHGFDRNGAS